MEHTKAAPAAGTAEAKVANVSDIIADAGSPSETESGASGGHPATAFLARIFGDAPWHLLAIKDKIIIGKTFKASPNRIAAVERWTAKQGPVRDIYFSINPLNCDLSDIKPKAAKPDIAEARWLWADVDPPKQADRSHDWATDRRLLPGARSSKINSRSALLARLDCQQSRSIAGVDTGSCSH